jgi:hypothetical protein
LHLIETVYGLNTNTTIGIYGNSRDKIFVSLNKEQQRKATMFFDYLGNHVTWYYTEDPKKFVPVPFNFAVPKQLEKTFKDKGFKIVMKENLGIEQASQVYHIHYVFEKK